LPPQQLAGQPAGQQQQQQLQQAPGQQQPAARRTLEDSYRSRGPEWRSRRVAAALMSRALQAHDLQWVAERRAGLKEVGRLDVGLARRLAGQLPAQGMREAFESVLVGDMVVRHQTRHWQQHDGSCLCGLGQESVDHVFWHCPRYASHRLGGGRCGTAASGQLHSCQRVLGAPSHLEELEAWRVSQAASIWVRPQWRAGELYVDAPGRQPKDPQVRIVGWAICGQAGGTWVSIAGWLEPGASVASGEAVAAARGTELLEPWGLLVTDCLAVKKMWSRIRREPHFVIEGVSHPCWVLLAKALAQHPTARCAWMRSHRSAEEALAEGYPPIWHAGNARADEAAKQAALEHDVPLALLSRWRQHVVQAERAASTVAAILLARLQSRARTDEGGAIKERSRQPPALPRRLRPKGLKRRRPAASLAQHVLAQLPRRAQEALTMEQLLQAKVRELPSQEAAMEVVFADAAPAVGIHDLRPAGPWPLPGTVPPLNGRVPGSWVCSRCSRTAGNTSRAIELARKPCGAAGWTAAAALHALVPRGEGWQCSRCLLTVRPQHAAQTARQRCPVLALSLAGTAWLEGEASLRAVLGRIRAFRHYCCPEAPAEEEQEQQQQLQAGRTPAGLIGQTKPLDVDVVQSPIDESPSGQGGRSGSRLGGRLDPTGVELAPPLVAAAAAAGIVGVLAWLPQSAPGASGGELLLAAGSAQERRALKAATAAQPGPCLQMIGEEPPALRRRIGPARMSGPLAAADLAAEGLGGAAGLLIPPAAGLACAVRSPALPAAAGAALTVEDFGGQARGQLRDAELGVAVCGQLQGPDLESAACGAAGLAADLQVAFWSAALPDADLGGRHAKPTAAAAAEPQSQLHAEASELSAEPARKARRLGLEIVSSPFFALQPYASHKPAFVGRNLWCLDCFEVLVLPIGAGGMVSAEVRSLPRPCRQLLGTALHGNLPRARSSKLASRPAGRCSLELWGFTRRAEWPVKPRSSADVGGSSGRPPPAQRVPMVVMHWVVVLGVC
jgi:hypothetical protein